MRYLDARDLASCLRALAPGETRRFEEEFAAHVGARRAIGTSFGRTALCLALRAIGVAGHEVLLPAFVCSVVRHAVVGAGATAKFVDVDPQTFEMDLDDLRRKLEGRVKAVVLIHYFGAMAVNLREVAAIAREHGVAFVEDCAHVLGARANGVQAGRSGDVAIYSLTKNTLNFGGGVLTTDRDDLHGLARAIVDAERQRPGQRLADFPLVLAYGLEQAAGKLDRDRIRQSRGLAARLPAAVLQAREGLLRLRGRGRRGAPSAPAPSPAGTGRDPASWTYRFRMEPVIAAVGRSQLAKLDRLNDGRRAVAAALGLAGQGLSDGGVHTFAVLRSRRPLAETIAAAAGRGLRVRATWPTRQRLWEGQDTPALRQIATEVCTWALHPGLTPEEIARFRSIADDLGLSWTGPASGGRG